MIVYPSLTSIAHMMTKLLTPDYFTKNTCLFKDNFLHEMPFDVQIAIMDEVDILDEKELKRKAELEEVVADLLSLTGDEPKDIVAHAVSNILWELKYRINEDDDDDRYQDLLHTLINEECDKDFEQMGKKEKMEIVVNSYGVMDLLKELRDEYDLDIKDYTSDELYAKCYYMRLYNLFRDEDFSCDDIKIIQKYNINVLINDEDE